MMRRLAGVLFVLSWPLLAQQHPNAIKGFNANSVYQVNDYDSINAFNGNLTISIPIGGAYPITSDYSVQLMLHGNSNVWEPVVAQDANCTYNGDPVVYNQAVPHRRANAGLGWTLSLGRLYGSNHETTHGSWVYESADGADHKFGGDPDEAPVTTADGTHLRLKTSGLTATIEFPDGMVHTFEKHPHEEEYLLKKIARANVSLVTFSYCFLVADICQETNVPSDAPLASWSAYSGADAQPFVTVGFTDVSYEGQGTRFAETVKLRTTGGGVATYTLRHEADRLGRPLDMQPFETKYCEALPRLAAVSLLTGIILPDSTMFTFEYDRSKHGASPAGLPTKMTIPTGGAVGWRYGHSPKPDWSAPRGKDEEGFQSPFGVSERYVYESDNTTVASLMRYTNTYDDDADPDPNNASPDETTKYQLTTITAVIPAKVSGGTEQTFQVTETFHNVEHQGSNLAVRGRHYGRPFASVFPDSANVRFLSQRVYEGNKSQLRQSTYVRYDDDHGASTLDTEFDPAVNARVVARRVIHHDVTNDGVNDEKVLDTSHEEWDRYGHFRKTIMSGTALGGLARTITTDYTASPATTATNWFLNLYRSVEVKDVVAPATGGAVKTNVARTEYCIDQNTALLRWKRTLRDVAATPARSNADLLSVYTHDTAGNVTEEAYYGGDWPALSGQIVNEDCSPVAARPAAPYSIKHAYASGVRNSSQYEGVSFKSLNLAVDAASRLPISTTDAAGVKTSVQYDQFGRVVALRPDGSAWTHYVYTPASPSTLPSVTVQQLPLNSSVGALTESRYYYDGFGRLVQESRRVPGGWSSNWTQYDEFGRKRAATVPIADVDGTRKLSPTGAAATTWAYDRMGRVKTVTLPDGGTTTYEYGVMETVRTSSIRTEQGDALVKTRERSDGLGRLTGVIENYGDADPAKQFATDYAYDVGDRLALVTMGEQTREFKYDGAGLLTSEAHPESGTTSYSYDARGHVRTRTAQAGGVVTFDYDKAERLRRVTEGTAILKEFTFDPSKGRMTSATRHNRRAELPGGDGNVEEQFFYDGTTGQLKEKKTSVTLGAEVFQFTDSYVHDQRGDLVTTFYPTCALCPGLVAPKRSVAMSRQDGFVTDVAPYTAGIEYGASGALEKLTRRNSDNGTGPVYRHNRDALGRTASIEVSRYCDDLQGVSLTTSPNVTAAGGVRGQQVTITANVNGTASALKWYRRDASGDHLLPGTSSSIAVTVGDPTEYFVRAANSTCAVDSPVITIFTCGDPSVAIAAPDSVTPKTTQRASVTETPGASYQWSITNGQIIGTSNAASVEFTANCTGLVKLTVSVIASCGTAYGERNISVHAARFTVTGSREIPSGGSATLTIELGGTGPWDVVWHDKVISTQEVTTRTVRYTSSPASRSVSPSTETSYTASAVTTVDGQCELTSSGTDSATIKIGAGSCAPQTPEIDDGGITSLRASRGVWVGVVPKPGETYKWTVTNGTFSAGTDTQVALYVAPGCSGTMTVTVTASKCGVSSQPASKTFSIEPPSAQIQTQSSHLTYVPGGPGVAIGFDIDSVKPEITWSDGVRDEYEVGSFTSQTRVVTPSVTTTYQITRVRDLFGCSASGLGSSVVSVCMRPPSTITAPSSMVAFETRTASVPPTANATYKWTVTGGVADGSDSEPNFTYRSTSCATPVELTVTVTPYCGAAAASSSTVVVAVTKAVAVMTGSTTIAQGDSAAVEVSLGGVGPWTLSFDGVSHQITSSPGSWVVRPDATTTYSVSNVIDGNGCTVNVSGAAVVTVVPPTPVVVATATSPTTIRVSWTLAGSADTFTIYRDNVLVATRTASPFDDAVAAGSAHVYTVVAAKGGTASRHSARELATAKLFAQELIPDFTTVAAVDIYEVRDAVNAVRALAGLGPFVFTDAQLINVDVKTVHITELRTNLDDARARLGLLAVGYVNTPLVPDISIIEASDVLEIRRGVQ